MDILSVNIKVLKWLRLWSDLNEDTKIHAIKNWLFAFTTYPSAITIVMAVVYQSLHGVEDVESVIDNFVTLSDFIGFNYMFLCFHNNIHRIRDCVTEVEGFKKFCSETLIIKTEDKVKKYTKGVFLYGVIGLTCNAAVPLLDMGNCNKRRSNDILRKRDPCGVMARCFYPFDVNYFPVLPLVFFLQLHTCIVISMVVLASTMCLIGFLIHGIEQLKHCRYLVTKIFNEECDNSFALARETANKMIFCIRYHIYIIDYAKHIDEAFSSMMLVHISLTSLVISVLGYEILMVDNAIDRIRFVMHLFGWLGLLFMTCFYGQELIDESTGIAKDAYRSKWYNGPVSIQKSVRMMIMRAQKPLTLSATSLGIMSFQTFLKVLRSAYSYFTLLLTITAK